MHENRNPLLFSIEINNMHHTRHILPIPRTCIWGRCGRCGRCDVSWHREVTGYQIPLREDTNTNSVETHEGAVL